MPEKDAHASHSPKTAHAKSPRPNNRQHDQKDVKTGNHPRPLEGPVTHRGQKGHHNIKTISFVRCFLHTNQYTNHLLLHHRRMSRMHLFANH